MQKKLYVKLQHDFVYLFCFFVLLKEEEERIFFIHLAIVCTTAFSKQKKLVKMF